MNYKIYHKSKNNGEYRIIYIVNSEIKQKLKSFLPLFENIFSKLNRSDICYSFITNKNCSLHAYQHIGYNFTLSLDIKDFFDSVTKEHFKNIVDAEIIEECFINNTLGQGLPTSPILSNIALNKTDNMIINMLNDMKFKYIYTRYADDMVFSFNEKDKSQLIFTIVKYILELNNFKLNYKKNKLQFSKNGRRVITGIAVDNSRIYATRKTKKKIRSALHKGNIYSLIGLHEYEKCKLPRKVIYE